MRAVRIALHHHRAVLDVREEQRRDVGVVLEQVALGEPSSGQKGLSRFVSATSRPCTVSFELPDFGMSTWNGHAAIVVMGRAYVRFSGACNRTS